jgi:GlcNAc-P-P-Und epimerase
MSCVVIFGGIGFIGLSYAEKALKDPHIKKIFIFDIKSIEDNSNYSKANLEQNNKIHYVRGDVRRPISDFTHGEKVSLIINLAAIHREPGHRLEEYYETNILGAENVCEFAEKVKCNKIIFSSSIAPYGPSEKIKDELSLPCPVTPYGNSKLIAEKIHLIWFEKNAKSKILQIVRPGIVYGSGEGGNMTRLVKAIEKRIFFYTANKNTRKAGVYIDELLNMIRWVLSNQIKGKLDSKVLYNATYWPNPSINDYAKTISKVLKIKPPVLNLPFFLLSMIACGLELISKLFKLNNVISPVRIRKLTKSNLIKPSFLLRNKYKFKYTLHQAFSHWKNKNKEDWK